MLLQNMKLQEEPLCSLATSSRFRAKLERVSERRSKQHLLKLADASHVVVDKKLELQIEAVSACLPRMILQHSMSGRAEATSTTASYALSTLPACIGAFAAYNFLDGSDV